MTDNNNLRGPRGSERLVAQQRKKKSSLFGPAEKANNDMSARMMMGASPQSIGADLRAIRMERGESTADVAHQLCLRESYIVAIEAGNFAELPGVVYAVGFLRSYARYLRLDADELIQRFKEEVSEIPPAADLAFFEPVSEESRVPRGGLVAFAVLLAVIAYAGWYYLSTRDMTIADLVPAVPEQFAGLVAPTGRFDPPPSTLSEYGELAPSGPGESADSAVSDGSVVDSAPPAPERLDLEQSQQDSASSRAVATSPEAVPGAAGVTAATRASPQAATSQPSDGARPSEAAAGGDGLGPQVFGEINGGTRIMLRSTGDSWIQVRTADETVLMTRILRSGDIYYVPNLTGLKLMTGNAGMLEVLVDEQPVPALGPVGSVRRNVQLEPERLKAGTAVVN